MLDVGILTGLLSKNDKNRREPQIQVQAMSFDDLFSESSFSFVIPEYQRPYVWSYPNLEVLINDYEDYLHGLSSSVGQQSEQFYMGSILLHKKEGNILSVIDGQQRITTLLALDYLANRKESVLVRKANRLSLTYRSPLSRKNIARNRDYLRNTLGDRLFNNEYKSFIRRTAVTVVITDSEDDAFAFFETQNSRGVNLSAIDFLKSYHLRALKGREELQRGFANGWDRSNQGQFLKILFDQFLWRGRNWLGRDFGYESKELVLEEFQKNTVPADSLDTITLYPNNHNRHSDSMSFSPKLGFTVSPKTFLIGNDPLSFPFSLRQPVQKGMGFFLYTERYCSMYKFIFENPAIDAGELAELIDFYSSVYSGVSFYLQSLFELCAVMYYDKFQKREILTFGLWLDYLLGSFRTAQRSIVSQTPVKILRENSRNLLDVIESAYRPVEIFNFLQSVTRESNYKLAKDDGGTGVQARYIQQVKRYYNKTKETTLANKRTWINEKVRAKIGGK
jgi:hypothetical protein